MIKDEQLKLWKLSDLIRVRVAELCPELRLSSIKPTNDKSITFVYRGPNGWIKTTRHILEISRPGDIEKVARATAAFIVSQYQKLENCHNDYHH